MSSIIECNNSECEICYDNTINSNIYCKICNKNMCLSCLINVKKGIGIDYNLQTIVYGFKCPFCRSYNELDILKKMMHHLLNKYFIKLLIFWKKLIIYINKLK